MKHTKMLLIKKALKRNEIDFNIINKRVYHNYLKADTHTHTHKH